MSNFKVLVLLILFFVTALVSGQNKFEKGYIIEKSGDSIFGYIKNLRWLDSPKSILFKSNSEDSDVRFDVDMIKQFKVQNGPLYVMVKDSFPITEQFVKEKNIEVRPLKVLKSRFVKLVLKGKASLYEYKGDGDLVYLVSKNNGQITPLDYKQYFVPRTYENKENPLFRSYLYKFFSCNQNVSIQNVQYTKKSLLDYLKSYNNCNGDISVEIQSDSVTNEKQKADIRMIVFGGLVNYSYNTTLSMTMAGSIFPTSVKINFDGSISPTLGMEIESIFPFNNNKWSIFLSGQFSRYSSTGFFNSSEVASIKLNQLIFNIGGRHYLFLNDKNSFHLMAGMNSNFNLNSEFVEQAPFSTPFTEISNFNLGGFVGFGFSIKQNLYININYLLGSGINSDVTKNGDLKRLMLSVGYKL